MKKLSLILVICIMLIMISPIMVSAAKVGDPLGDVLYSDITAYINGHAIPTSVIEGKTLVAVEDLAKYGFDVKWDGTAKTLKVELNKNKEFKPLSVKKDTTNKPGTFKCKYVYTDIKTYLSGELVESFAVDGVTLIDFDLLGKYGKFQWDGSKREIKLTLNSSTPSVKMYVDFPSVPDFGAFSGTELVDFDSVDRTIGYWYDGYSTKMVNDYCELLKNCGFSYWSTNEDTGAVFYRKDNIIVFVNSYKNKETVVGLIIEDETIALDSSSQGNKSAVAYYKDYSTVPDFGAFSGAKLNKTVALDDGTVGYFYDIYSQKTINTYNDLLKDCGFVHHATYGNDVLYQKDNIVVSAFLWEDEKITIVMIEFLDEVITPSENKNTVVYYKDYPTVPDFGAFANFDLDDISIESDYIAYYYINYSISVVNNYINLLKELGFSFYYTDKYGDDWYIKDNVLVCAYMESYGTAVFVTND